MFGYIIKKLYILLLFIFFLSIVVFIISRLSPGEPLYAFYGEAVEHMSILEHQQALTRLGLDKPFYLQYLTWISNIFTGDFGISLKYKQPAIDILLSFLNNTIYLGLISYILVFGLAIICAIFCVYYENTLLDKCICKLGTIIYYIPSFWLGLILILIFSINIPLLPTSGAFDIGMEHDIFNRLKHMLLPLIVMIVSHLWYYTYIIREKLLLETRKDYVLLAKAKGLSKLYILIHHCLKNVLPTIINIMSISATHILSGTYIVEAVFSYPGIGYLSIESAKYHDYNLLMLIVLFTGFIVIIFSLSAQIINELIDPRITFRRTPHEHKQS